MKTETRARHAPPHPLTYKDGLARPAVEWLIDNQNTYKALIRELRNARSSIRISQLAFDADCTAYADNRTDEGDDESPTDVRLLDVILEVSKQHDVDVEILLNSSILVDTTAALRRAIAQKGGSPSRIRVRGVNRFPQLLHAKMVIIDDSRAFVVGSPFVNGYGDDSSHAPSDPRRPRRELGGRPVHDVSLLVCGETAQELSGVFGALWDSAERTRGSECKAARAPSPNPNKPVRVVTTLPACLNLGHARASGTILDALLEAIDGAEDLIYIEHQYLSSKRIASALRAALDRRPGLQIVMLLNQNPDVTAYRGWQNSRLAESGLIAHPRVGLFALWTAGAHPRNGQPEISQVFVHSKVVIVDDRWAMVGSANLDGVSLDSYGNDFEWTLPRRLFKDVRNVDVALVFDQVTGTGLRASSVRSLRQRLWQEHLGGTAYDTDSHHSSTAVDRWRARASAHVLQLNDSRARSDLRGSFILPLSLAATPRRQLADVGVTETISLAFDPSWLEVHCSPGWVRNMFL